MKILVNGTGIAGPTLAYWLACYGHEPTLLEVAPQLRTGGYIIDFWGVGYDIAERMGLLPDIESAGYRLEAVRLVDARNRHAGGFDASVFARATNGRFVSLPRAALAELLFGAVAGNVETLFGDEIVALEPGSACVRVRFRHAARDFDLVVGADGLHSKVRTLCFGEEREFTRYLGYKVAAFEVPGYVPREELTYVSYALPGRQAARFSLRNDKTLVLLVMADEIPAIPRDPAQQRSYLHERFDDAGWECRQMMAAMDRCNYFYFDEVSQIRMPTWSKDRVALVGDAATCPSLLAGEGASLGMAEAYVLAGELHRAHGDYATGFEHYEALLRPFIERKQSEARRFASSFAPRSALDIWFRNLVTKAMRIPFVADLALGRIIRDDFDLPAYE